MPRRLPTLAVSTLPHINELSQSARDCVIAPRMAAQIATVFFHRRIQGAWSSGSAGRPPMAAAARCACTDVCGSPAANSSSSSSASVAAWRAARQAPEVRRRTAPLSRAVVDVLPRHPLHPVGCAALQRCLGSGGAADAPATRSERQSTANVLDIGTVVKPRPLRQAAPDSTSPRPALAAGPDALTPATCCAMKRQRASQATSRLYVSSKKRASSPLVSSLMKSNWFTRTLHCAAANRLNRSVASGRALPRARCVFHRRHADACDHKNCKPRWAGLAQGGHLRPQYSSSQRLMMGRKGQRDYANGRLGSENLSLPRDRFPNDRSLGRHLGQADEHPQRTPATHGTRAALSVCRPRSRGPTR